MLQYSAEQIAFLSLNNFSHLIRNSILKIIRISPSKTGCKVALRVSVNKQHFFTLHS